MSKKGSPSKDDNQVPDLSALDFGPAWARPKQGNQDHQDKKARRSDAGKSGNDNRGNRDKRDQREGGRRHSPVSHHHGGGPREGHRDDHRGGHRKDGKHGSFASKGGRERRPAVEAPEGVTARIMPIEAGMDAMAKQISATGRTHSVFDLAWLVLGALDRFHVIFENKQQPLYRSESDHSVWLSQKECLSHLWSSGMVNRFYDEEITEVEAPAGNFQSVARCGLSGKLIGPPNHHGYQQALTDLHRERFANMPLDLYKSKIVMEQGEEVVQEWIDAMRQRKRWRPRVEAEVEVEDQAEPEVEVEVEAEAQAEPEVELEVAEKIEVEAQAEAKVEEGVEAGEEVAEEEQAEPEVEVEAQAANKETLPALDSRDEVEQHFLAHGFEQEFVKGDLVSALANIPARMISPGLMTLLRNTVAEEKRYPGNLASFLCRQMSGRHLAVFKWKKRLHCGPARPRHVPDELVMADRPSCLFHWVLDHPGGNIDAMWKECLPADIDDATRRTWYHDLHWLINEGLVLLFSDGTMHAAKELQTNAAPQKGATAAAAEAPSKPAKAKKAASKTPAKAAKKAAKKAADKEAIADQGKTKQAAVSETPQQSPADPAPDVPADPPEAPPATSD